MLLVHGNNETAGRLKPWYLEEHHQRSHPGTDFTLPLPKFNNSPLKSYQKPIGKDRLQGRAVKLRGCNFLRIDKVRIKD